jgi:predicted nuclease of predicted toxin-antitoxin system
LTRLLLDEHLSGRAIGKALEEHSHDVRAISGDKSLEGLEDDAVLDLAISEGRILVTANVSDFIPLLTRLAEAGKSHTGCLLIPNSFRNEDFGAIVSAIERQLGEVPQEAWKDHVAWLRK